VTVESTSTTWTARMEAALASLRDVDAVAVRADGTVIREIHVVTSSERRPNLLVRDIQTLLLTRFQVSIDRRVVSVVHVAPGEPAPAAAIAALAVAPAPRPRRAMPEPAPAAADPEPETPLEERIRFGSVNLYVAGSRAQAQVELRWKGVPRMGSASGWSTRDGAHRLIATATLNSIQEFLDDDVALGVADVEFVQMGRRQVVVVGLTLLAHRQEKLLVGSCTVEQDVQQAVVLATLTALNRVVGGLRTKEPTEYILRPASVREESGARGGS
jgi:hypothetical protein